MEPRPYAGGTTSMSKRLVDIAKEQRRLDRARSRDRHPKQDITRVHRAEEVFFDLLGRTVAVTGWQLGGIPILLNGSLPRPSFKTICDTAVTSRLPTASEIGDCDLKIGRGPGM